MENLLGRRPTKYDYACMSLLTYRDMSEDDIRADAISAGQADLGVRRVRGTDGGTEFLSVA